MLALFNAQIPCYYDDSTKKMSRFDIEVLHMLYGYDYLIVIYTELSDFFRECPVTKSVTD